MSNNVTQSHDSDGVSGQHIHSISSPWIAHWMKPPNVDDKLSLEFKSNEDSHGEQEISELSKYDKVLRVLPEKAVEIVNNDTRSSNPSINQSIDSYSPSLYTKKVSRLPVDLNFRYIKDTFDANEIPIQPEGTSENFGQLVKYQYIMENEGLTPPRSSNGKFMGSTSILSNVHGSKNVPVQSLMHMSEQVSQSDFGLAQKDYQNSKLLPTSLIRKKDGGLLLHDTSISNYQVSDLFGESNRKIQTHSDIRFLPTQISLPRVDRSQYANHGHGVLKQLPYSIDIETTRVRTIVESETTRHMLITRNADTTSLSEKDVEIIRESSKLTNNYTDFGSLGQPRSKLQLLDSSTDGERQKNMGVARTSKVDSKNDSSTETHIMDMVAFKETYNDTDLTLSVPNKDYTKGKNVSSSEVGPSSSNRHAELPDINEDLPVGDGEPSSSRTQSLDMDLLFSNGDNLESNPNTRWVKRLKMNGSDSFAHGTKSSKLEDSSSDKKVNKFFEILKGSITPNTKPTSDANHGARQMVPFIESVKKGENLTLSHSWVRRWCRNQDLPARQKNEAVVACEPQRSTKPFQEFQKEHFPSIAAMALMGKAMNGFRPCEFRKRGSLIVWNTEEV